MLALGYSENVGFLKSMDMISNVVIHLEKNCLDPIVISHHSYRHFGFSLLRAISNNGILYSKCIPESRRTSLQFGGKTRAVVVDQGQCL